MILPAGCVVKAGFGVAVKGVAEGEAACLCGAFTKSEDAGMRASEGQC